MTCVSFRSIGSEKNARRRPWPSTRRRFSRKPRVRTSFEQRRTAPRRDVGRRWSRVTWRTSRRMRPSDFLFTRDSGERNHGRGADRGGSDATWTGLGSDVRVVFTRPRDHPWISLRSVSRIFDCRLRQRRNSARAPLPRFNSAGRSQSYDTNSPAQRRRGTVNRD